MTQHPSARPASSRHRAGRTPATNRGPDDRPSGLSTSGCLQDDVLPVGRPRKSGSAPDETPADWNQSSWVADSMDSMCAMSSERWTGSGWMNPRAVTRLATRGRLLVCAALLSVTGVATETSPSIRPAIESYRSAIAAAEDRAEPRGVESALAALRNLELLLHASVPGGRRSVFESLSQAEFAMVHQLPGVMVRREEILMVEPDPDFLVELSALVGDEADRRFAAALAATHHYGRWPVYIQPQTD